jgi:sodium-dependent dicarboxylate transporter 2/3/5
MADSRYYSTKQLSSFRQKVERQSRTIMFLSSALLAFILTYTLRSDDFSPSQDYVMFLLFFSVGLWITEAVPPFAVGILIVGYLVFTLGRVDGYDVEVYVRTWSDGVIWLFLGGFFLAEGMKKTRLDYQLFKFSAPKFGNKAKNILLGLMSVTAVTSSMMSNTATTVMMLATLTPLFDQIKDKSNVTKAFLLGIPSAAAIGGMGTIIGSAPNAIAVGALESLGIKVSFLSWMSVGIPVVIILIYTFWRVLVSKYNIKNEVLDLSFLESHVEEDEEFRKENIISRHIVISIFGVTLLLWLTSQWTQIPVSAISGIPIVGLTLLGIIDADEVRSLPWDTLMLVAGGLALGIAIQEQGLAGYFIESINITSFNFLLLIVIFAYISVLLSNFMSNTAATTILVPVAVSLLSLAGDYNPAILTLVIGLSASCALLLPVSTPPNAVAYSTGRILQSDFRLGGIYIGLLGPLVIIGICLLIL